MGGLGVVGDGVPVGVGDPAGGQDGGCIVVGAGEVVSTIAMLLDPTHALAEAIH